MNRWVKDILKKNITREVTTPQGQKRTEVIVGTPISHWQVSVEANTLMKGSR